jgi:3-hydroxyisobutyrate dehydrogenase
MISPNTLSRYSLGSEPVAFLGLGVMGTPMVVNLLRQGFSVKAWNRTPDSPNVAIVRQAGAIIAPSIREAVSEAAIICTCVSDIPDVREVILGTAGVAHHAPAGAIIIDFSTIGSNAARQLARELAAYHLRFLDAPISGGDIGAQQGTLTIMVGGTQEDFSQCQTLFAALGKTIRLCGAVGSGQAVKLCNQVLVAIHMVALCEALEFAQIQGLDPNLMVEVCSTGAAGSWALANLGPKIVEGDYAPGFTIQHILKDLRLVRETLENASEELPAVALANRLFQMASELDRGEGAKQGTQAMIRAYG